MEHQVMSIRDAAVEAYGRPFFTPTLGAASRAFTDEVNRQHQDNELNKHPDDHDLYHLGTFDDQTGKFKQLPEPRIIAKGKDVATQLNLKVNREDYHR